MLSHKTSLRDVKDVEAFVIMCIKRSGIHPDPREYEDLVAHGLMLLWEMSTKYNEQIGCFSGYALRYMPRKMKEAYHRSHEHHVHKTQPDGTRKWEFGEDYASWDALTHVDRTHPHPTLDETKIRQVGDFITPQTKRPDAVRAT